MKRKSEPPRSHPYVRLSLLFVGVGAFLAGVIFAGRWGLDQLRGRERYDVPFADIECEAPVGMDRQQFLDEVRYPNRLPDRLHLLDDDLLQKLHHEFAQHPWVARVDEVRIVPPKRVLVTLTHRVPVLAVNVDGSLRAVDGVGVVLPINAPTQGLPIFYGDAKAPAAAGQRWGDPNVEAAARKLKK